MFYQAVPFAWNFSPNKAGQAPTASNPSYYKSLPLLSKAKHASTSTHALTPIHSHVPNVHLNHSHKCMRKTAGIHLIQNSAKLNQQTNNQNTKYLSSPSLSPPSISLSQSINNINIWKSCFTSPISSISFYFWWLYLSIYLSICIFF